MTAFDVQDYHSFFGRITGNQPYDYQVRVARRLAEGKNLVVAAPTGAGKTHAVLVPFLYLRDRGGPRRMIYALPMRTLANNIHREAQRVGDRYGIPEDQVTIQTGEHPEDEFFNGTIVVATYDQVLSGLLCGPYGLSARLDNVNASAIAGALVVFDEFHLMEPNRAFLTGAAGLHLFRGLTQSVWMTATATSPLMQELAQALDCKTESLSSKDYDKLPSVSQVKRHLTVEPLPLTADTVLMHHSQRSIVVLNQVERAQKLYDDLRHDPRAAGINKMLLHSRFFRDDRATKEKQLQEWFGKDSTTNAILVTTQVVEAGLDISADQLHTELCPMNALVQRAGRCARYQGQEGTVHVYPLPDDAGSHLPYDKVSVCDTWNALKVINPGQLITPEVVAGWVEQVHMGSDEKALWEGWRGRLRTSLEIVRKRIIQGNKETGVGDCIRSDDAHQVRVIVAHNPPVQKGPSSLESLAVSRYSLRGCFELSESPGWIWNPDAEENEQSWIPLGDHESLKDAIIVCLRPSVAAYDAELGLRVGVHGEDLTSPERPPRKHPGYGKLEAEAWIDHALGVSNECIRRFEAECPSGSYFARGLEARFGLGWEQMKQLVGATGFLHDLGKLNSRWQAWARKAQEAADPSKLNLMPLAHTDFDYNKPEDRAREAQINKKIRRPSHAAAGAYLAVAWYESVFYDLADGQFEMAASICSAAILSHHGGWRFEDQDLSLGKIEAGWKNAPRHLLPVQSVLYQLLHHPEKKLVLENILNKTMHADEFEKWWPLAAYVMRTLRLSDQRATREGGPRE